MMQDAIMKVQSAVGDTEGEQHYRVETKEEEEEDNLEPPFVIAV